MDALQRLAGLVVNKALKVHDYIQLYFSDGTILTINNRYDYDNGPLSAIEGRVIDTATEDEVKVLLNFRDGSCLSIGMEDQDYDCPEAMVLVREGEPDVVWN